MSNLYFPFNPYNNNPFVVKQKWSTSCCFLHFQRHFVSIRLGCFFIIPICLETNHFAAYFIIYTAYLIATYFTSIILKPQQISTSQNLTFSRRFLMHGPGKSTKYLKHSGKVLEFASVPSLWTLAQLLQNVSFTSSVFS